MSELNLDGMKRDLLLGGIAPKTVTRLLAELTDHIDDLKAQAIAEGKSELEATAYADEAIGRETEIVSGILERPELKSYSWRYPKAVFLAGPMLLLLGSVGLFLLSLLGVTALYPEFFELKTNTSIAPLTKAALQSILFFNCYLLTPALAAGFCVLAKKRSIPMLWPLIGACIVAVFGSGFAYTLTWPSELAEGSLSINWGYSFLPRYIRGDHDLQNYMQILAVLIMFAGISQKYRPFEVSH